MNKKRVLSVILTAIVFTITTAAVAFSDKIQTITLPPPEMDGGMPLMKAIKERKSTRSFAPDTLPPQTLSNLLWAAFGISRLDSDKRTAPSAHNWQEIDVYVAREDGLFVYDPKAHALHLVVAKDIREQTGVQPFVTEAPVNLIFVADLSKMGNAGAEDKAFYAAVDAGFISQNVYLDCASEGLATVVRRWIDRPELAKAMKLGPHQDIILAQTVGYFKK